MDNLGIARVFTDIGDLLEIKNANPFKVRAYRNAADIVGHMAERIADLTDAQVRALPGIGKDLSAKIRALSDTGALAYYDESTSSRARRSRTRCAGASSRPTCGSQRRRARSRPTCSGGAVPAAPLPLRARVRRRAVAAPARVRALQAPAGLLARSVIWTNHESTDKTVRSLYRQHGL